MSIYYLAYGSNLHPIRLTARIPFSTLVGPVKLAGYQLHFHKRGSDASGKCNMVSTNSTHDIVYGSLYHMDKEHKKHLDKIEGPGYESQQLHVSCNDTTYQCFAYFAQYTHIENDLLPYDWYHSLVHLGAKYMNFPQEYITHINNTARVADPSHERNMTHKELIEKIRIYNAK